MREDDVRLALANPMISIGTDSGARAEDGPFSESKSHPRAWGSFTRILGKYVRDEKLIPLEEAIRRFTSRPAARVGLADRGILRPGMKADVTIFDPATVRDVSTFVDPTHYSQGIEHVLVNGKAVVSGGKITERAARRKPIRGTRLSKVSRKALALATVCTGLNLVDHAPGRRSSLCRVDPDRHHRGVARANGASPQGIADEPSPARRSPMRRSAPTI